MLVVEMMSSITLHIYKIINYYYLPDPMLQQQATTSKKSHVHKMKKLKKKKKEADPTWYQPRKPTTKNSVASKILDITTLKQQPKLL